VNTPPFISLALLSVAILASACDNASSSAAAQQKVSTDPQSVKVVRVNRTPLVHAVTVSGTLAAEEQVMLSLKVTGRLEELSVDLGSRVTRGQVIARLTPTDFILRLQQATAALQQARVRLGLPADGDDDAVVIEGTALVRQQKALFDEAKLQRDRIATFVERGISAKADLDTANAQLQVGESRYLDALEEARNRQAVLAQRRSEVAIARQQVEDSTLRSPIDGVVRERLAFAGEYRAAGTPIVTVVRQHPLRLQLSVPERSALEIRMGQKVLVTVEGDPDTYEGRVARLSPAITEGNRTLPLEAEVPNQHGKLRPGTFARAEIITSEQPGIVIPHTALVVFAGVEKVFAVADGKATEKRVRTGRRFTETIEIVEGLEPGDMVIVEPGAVTAGIAVTTTP
jgi:RND family efflux transporter MFP subunit